MIYGTEPLRSKYNVLSTRKFIRVKHVVGKTAKDYQTDRDDTKSSEIEIESTTGKCTWLHSAPKPSQLGLGALSISDRTIGAFRRLSNLNNSNA